MAFGSQKFFLYGANGRTITESKNLEAIFKGVAVSADGVDNGLNITESSGKFHFNSKVLSAIGAATGSGEAVEYDQYTTALGNKLDTSLKGAANGLAELDSGGKVPVTQLPNSIMEYKGMWSAEANNPTLADGTGNTGDVYRVNTAGSQDLGSGSISFEVGDYVIYNGATWEKSDTTDAVASVNGYTGVVSLWSDDITEGGTNLYFTDARAKAAAVDDMITDEVTDRAPSQNAVYDALALKSDTTHDHAGVYSEVTHNHDSDYAALTHDHDSDYAALTHDHDSDYAALSHTHAISDITDLQTTLDGKASAADGYASFTNEEGTAITVGKFVFMSSAGNVSLLQSTDTVNEDTLIGCVKDASIDNAAAGAIWLPKRGTKIGGFSGLTIGSRLFAHASTAGSYVTTRPTSGKVIVLGMAISATEILFEGYFDYEYA